MKKIFPSSRSKVHLDSISSTFYMHVFLYESVFFAKAQLEKSTFVQKNRCVKCWWNWLLKYSESFIVDNISISEILQLTVIFNNTFSLSFLHRDWPQSQYYFTFVNHKVLSRNKLKSIKSNRSGANSPTHFTHLYFQWQLTPTFLHNAQNFSTQYLIEKLGARLSINRNWGTVNLSSAKLPVNMLVEFPFGVDFINIFKLTIRFGKWVNTKLVLGRIDCCSEFHQRFTNSFFYDFIGPKN